MMIGIITYYNTINYGAVFQALAMQEIIKEIAPNEKVGIVEYCPKNVSKSYALIKKSSWKAVIISLYNFIDNFARKKKFKKFINVYMNIIPLEEVKNADKLVLGSDQIWNPNISGGFKPELFGIFPVEKKQKVCSYAASIGVSNFNEEERKVFSRYIRNVQYISVREKEAKNIIQKVILRDIVVDIDPTLLVNKDIWSTLKIEPEIKNPYILVYSLSGYDLTDYTARKIAKKYNSEIVEISLKDKKPFVSKSFRRKTRVSPEEFLGWISSAEAVVTDSFHGTVFSILFHKDVYTIPNKMKASRMVELMEDLKIQSHIITKEEDVKFKKIDYDLVDTLLQEKKEKSFQHMLEILRI